MKNLRTRTLSGLGWSGTAKICRQLLQLVIIIILARILSPREFGLVGMVIVFTGFADRLKTMGLGEALIQKLNLTENHLSSAFWLNLIAGVVLMLIFVIGAPFIALFYNEPTLKYLTIVIAFIFFIGSLNIVQDALLKKNLEFRRLFYIEIASTLTAGIVAIIMAINGFGVWSLIAQSLVMTSVTVIIMWLTSSWRPSFIINKTAVRELWKFGSNLMGFNILTYLARNVDKLLIGKSIGTFALGIYSRAYEMMLKPVSEVEQIITRVMFPVLSEIQKDKKRIKQIYLRSIRSISIFIFPLMIGMIVLVKPLVLFIFGEKWEGIIPILQIFCFYSMLQSIGTTFGWIYNSQGRTDIQFRWGVFSSFISIVSIFIGLRWGIIGIATAYTISSYVILWYPGWTIPGRLINITFSEMIKKISAPFFCALAMGCAVFGVGIFLPSNWPDSAYLAIQAPLGIALYWLLLCIFCNEDYQETKKILGENLLSPIRKRIASLPLLQNCLNKRFNQKK